MSLKGPDVDRWRLSREGLRWTSDFDLLCKDADLREILSVPPLENVSIAQSGQSAGDGTVTFDPPSVVKPAHEERLQRPS